MCGLAISLSGELYFTTMFTFECGNTSSWFGWGSSTVGCYASGFLMSAGTALAIVGGATLLVKLASPIFAVVFLVSVVMYYNWELLVQAKHAVVRFGGPWVMAVLAAHLLVHVQVRRLDARTESVWLVGGVNVFPALCWYLWPLLASLVGLEVGMRTGRLAPDAPATISVVFHLLQRVLA